MIRLIAGQAYRLSNSENTFSPLFYLHLNLDTHAKINLPNRYSERALYIVKGNISLGMDTFTAGQLLIFSKLEDPIITANSASPIMLLGGEPLGNRYIWWNFVSSRKERIVQAKTD